jgi:hypothetical protein
VRFKLDENMPRRARERLESQGWDVHDVHQEGLVAALDQAIQATLSRASSQ